VHARQAPIPQHCFGYASGPATRLRGRRWRRRRPGGRRRHFRRRRCRCRGLLLCAPSHRRHPRPDRADDHARESGGDEHRRRKRRRSRRRRRRRHGHRRCRCRPRARRAKEEQGTRRLARRLGVAREPGCGGRRCRRAVSPAAACRDDTLLRSPPLPPPLLPRRSGDDAKRVWSSRRRCHRRRPPGAAADAAAARSSHSCGRPLLLSPLAVRLVFQVEIAPRAQRVGGGGMRRRNGVSRTREGECGLGALSRP
jgi:hypothetical protein